MKNQNGFTLIELMMVVVVTAILLVIAIPAYNDQIRKSRRAQAKTDLTEQSQILERMFTVSRDYSVGTNSMCAGGGGTNNVTSPLVGTPTWYNIAATCTQTGGAGPYTAYTLTATPAGDQAKDKCGTLSITSAGVKSPSGTTPACW